MVKMNCKCKKCKSSFETEVPSRIANPLCASCLAIERKQKMKEPVGLPSDFAKVQAELRKEFGKCPNCPAPLIPLQAFKVDGQMYCESCYSNIMHLRYKGGIKKEIFERREESIQIGYENAKENVISISLQEKRVQEVIH